MCYIESQTKKKQEGQLEAFKIWRYLSKSLESENRFKIGFCPAQSVWTHKLFRFQSFLLLCLGHCRETRRGLKGGRVGRHTMEMLIPQAWAQLGEELPGSALTESHTPFFLPIGQDSTFWSFSFLAAKPHRTKPLHIPHHPSQGWCLMLGHHQQNRGSCSLSLFFLASEPAKFKSES